MEFKEQYRSNGKLLITSEYVIIDGALALALPTKKGQTLSVKSSSEMGIHWTALNNDGEEWLKCHLDLNEKRVLSSSDDEKAQFLLKLLSFAKGESSRKDLDNICITTHLEFPNNWGLGSSSTLLCNIAKLFKIDPFKLHFEVTNGSGYDIANGMNDKGITYSLKEKSPTVAIVDFNPSFKDRIYFVHLNQKQISSKEVGKYNDLKKSLDLKSITESFSKFTKDILDCESLERFEFLLLQHEISLSNILERETIKEQLFQMYQGGIVKSLGAWGGDFVLVTTKSKEDLNYFKVKGYNTILNWDEMILS